MSNVIVKENESLDSALRRFKRNCAKAGIQQEIRKREHYEKPSVRRKKKSEAARKRKYCLLYTSNIPAEVKHWHGAAPDEWFSHLAIEVPGMDCSNEWCEAVSEEEYAGLR